MSNTPYPGTGRAPGPEETPWDDLAGLLGTRPGATSPPPGVDLCGPGCQYRRLYEGTQLSLDDMHETLQEAVKKYENLRSGLISLTKRAFSGQVRRTERQLGKRISAFDDRQIIANLDDYIRNVTQPARTQKAGMAALRAALTQIGYELPDDDNPATWAAVIAATGPIGERKRGYPSSNLLGQDIPEVNTDTIDDDFAELLKDFDLPEITAGGVPPTPEGLEERKPREGTKPVVPEVKAEPPAARKDQQAAPAPDSGDEGGAAEDLLDLADLLSDSGEEPAAPGVTPAQPDPIRQPEEDPQMGDLHDLLDEPSQGQADVDVDLADELGLDLSAELDPDTPELDTDDPLLSDIDLDELMGDMGAGLDDLADDNSDVLDLEADLAELDNLTGAAEQTGPEPADATPDTAPLPPDTALLPPDTAPSSPGPAVAASEPDSEAVDTSEERTEPFHLEGYVLPGAVTAQHTRPGSLGLGPQPLSGQPAQQSDSKTKDRKGKTPKKRERKDTGVAAARPASFNFDVPDLAGVAAGEELPDELVEALVSAAESPRPVFIADLADALAGSGVDRETAEAWEAHMRGVNNPPVRFASGRKRHREQLGSLVLPHRMMQKPTPEFAKSTWYSVLATYKGVVLYEFAALLRSLGDTVISAKTAPDYAVMRANLPQGLTGIVVVTTTDPASVADSVAGEVRDLLDERLSSIMVLAARPDLEDVLVGKLDELLSDSQPFPTPVAVSSIWKYAQDRTGAAKLVGGFS